MRLTAGSCIEYSEREGGLDVGFVVIVHILTVGVDPMASDPRVLCSYSKGALSPRFISDDGSDDDGNFMQFGLSLGL